MSRKRSFVRRSRADDEPIPELAPDEPIVPGAAGEELPAAEPAPPRSPMDLGELEALAEMDRGELDAMLAGAGDTRGVREGERVTGTVTGISRTDLLVDVGAKSEATLPRQELEEEPRVGDAITAFVIRVDDHGVLLSTQLGGAAAESYLEKAQAAGTPVEGRVVGTNPGGFNVRLGRVPAFCPISHIERGPVAEPELHVGATYRFLVLEVGEDIVVSRRELLRAAAEENAAGFWTSAQVGDRMSGPVKSVHAFGAFVDLGGVDGLVPRRELGEDPTPGRTMLVRIQSLDPDTRRVSLSPEGEDASPWRRIGTDFLVGGSYRGEVTRVEPYGAFVQLAPGLRGMLHISNAGRTLPSLGEEVEVQILEVDSERQRLDLGPASGETETEPRSETPRSTQEGGFGTLGDLLGGWKAGG